MREQVIQVPQRFDVGMSQGIQDRTNVREGNVSQTPHSFSVGIALPRFLTPPLVWRGAKHLIRCVLLLRSLQDVSWFFGHMYLLDMFVKLPAAWFSSLLLDF